MDEEGCRYMPVFTFAVVLDHVPSDEEYDTLHEIAADDVGVETRPGYAVAQFDREAATCADAIASAVADLDRVGLRPLRFIDEDLLTLAEIADRIGRSRESVRRYSIGERGGGDFPPPVNPGHGGTVFYRWSEVAPWLRSRVDVDAPDVEPALVVANHLLQTLVQSPRVPNVGVLHRLFAALPPPDTMAT